jgi:heat shock protein HtpX
MFGRNNDDDDGGGFASLALLIVAPIAATLLQFAISRSREFSADQGGASISGMPLSLASALAKLQRANEQKPLSGATPASAHMFIVNPLHGGSIMKLFSTHPPVEERVKRLQEIAAGKR